MKIPNRIRYFNKRYLNRLTSRIARLRWGPFCMVYHVGRRSGKQYQTPIMAFPAPDGFVIVLTYGAEVDWYRNVCAAGSCQILWHARVYEIHKVEPMEPKAALASLPMFFRVVLRRVNFQDFVKMVGQSPRSG